MTNSAPTFQCPFSAGADLEQALARAKSLLQDEELEACLDLLTALEKKYVRAVSIFELLGELHVKLGDLQEGNRYRTLYETLRGTFRIAGETSKALFSEAEFVELGPAKGVETIPGWSTPGTTVEGPEFRSFAPELRPEVLTPESGGLFPVTTAMGEEFVKQGHFGRAAAIYEQLLKRHPENQELKTSLADARRKMREKKVLGILQSWLSNIERMKSVRQPKR